MSAVALVQNAPIAVPPAGSKASTFPLIRLSHSRRQSMLTCGRKYRYVYVDRLESEVSSYSLPFGGSVHSAIAQFLTAESLGARIDPVAAFDHAWNEEVKKPIQYSSIWSEDGCRATGRKLLELFEERWNALGWKVAMDKEGLPLIEREIHILLPENIVYIAIIDAIVITPDGRLVVIDFKTPGDASSETFAMVSDQLLGYQVAVDANRELLGLDRPVDGLAFFELVKRPIPKTKTGTGPHIVLADPVSPRSQSDIADWIRETQFVARDIREQRFSRRPMDSWNSSCDLCDYVLACHQQIHNGLRAKPKRG